MEDFPVFVIIKTYICQRKKPRISLHPLLLDPFQQPINYFIAVWIFLLPFRTRKIAIIISSDGTKFFPLWKYFCSCAQAVSTFY